MNVAQTEARKNALHAIRRFDKQVNRRLDRASGPGFGPYEDPVGRLEILGVELTLDGVHNQRVYVTALVDLIRSRFDEHLTTTDVENVARAAFTVGRTALIDADFRAAITRTPRPDVAVVAADIRSILRFIARARLDFDVQVIIRDLEEDVVALGYNAFGWLVEEASFAQRAQEHLRALHDATLPDWVHQKEGENVA